VGSQCVVDVRSPDEVRFLLLEIDDLADWMAVRVFDDRGDPPRCGGRRTRRKVLTAQIARFHEVNVGVDAAGKDEKISRIDRCRRWSQIGAHGDDLAVAYEQVGTGLPRSRDDDPS